MRLMNATACAGQRPLRIADHVRVCLLHDQAVLLDLRRSKYLSLSRDQWLMLIGDAAAPNQEQLAPQHAVSERSCPRAAESLLRQGLLTSLPRTPSASDDPRPATSSWLAPAASSCTSIGAMRIVRLIRAAAWAAFALRLRSLQHITVQIALAKARLRCTQADKHPRLDEAVAAFHALRPLLFTARDRCLNDSLALVAFLSSEGIAARWVIGVRSQPFTAHAWVQTGGMVLNDLHENVRHYEPILVV